MQLCVSVRQSKALLVVIFLKLHVEMFFATFTICLCWSLFVVVVVSKASSSQQRVKQPKMYLNLMYYLNLMHYYLEAVSVLESKNSDIGSNGVLLL